MKGRKFEERKQGVRVHGEKAVEFHSLLTVNKEREQGKQCKATESWKLQATQKGKEMTKGVLVLAQYLPSGMKQQLCSSKERDKPALTTEREAEAAGGGGGDRKQNGAVTEQSKKHSEWDVCQFGTESNTESNTESSSKKRKEKKRKEKRKKKKKKERKKKQKEK